MKPSNLPLFLAASLAATTAFSAASDRFHCVLTLKDSAGTALATSEAGFDAARIPQPPLPQVVHGSVVTSHTRSQIRLTATDPRSGNSGYVTLTYEHILSRDSSGVARAAQWTCFAPGATALTGSGATSVEDACANPNDPQDPQWHPVNVIAADQETPVFDAAYLTPRSWTFDSLGIKLDAACDYKQTNL